MINTIHKIITYLVILLGIIHIGFTARVSKFDLNVLWFIGAGFAIVFAGFLNLVFIRSERKDWFVRSLCIIADFTLTILFVVAFFTVLDEPQVIIGSLIFASATVFSILPQNK